MNVRKLTMLSMLISIAVIGRIYMTFIPNVQPLTTIIMITAVIMGRTNGILVATVSIIVSNLYLGFGIWTFPQIISYSLIAIICGSFCRLKDKKYFVYLLALIGVFAGYFHGLIMSLFEYLIFGNFWAYYLAGIPFDTYHAVGNLLISLILYHPIKSTFKIMKV
ncbi:ECF transporter S component [Amphibacillus sp. Q70]|uniref:ECF transporter S component n=1 Tax=Amphibacillus sp. Q70 TaxID=3453416 RepID=UPI003F84ECA3